MYKVRSTWYTPLRAYTGDPIHPQLLPLDHPLAVLAARPNAYQSCSEFFGLNTVYLNISGNSFVMLDRPSRKALPTAMYPLRPDRVYIIPESNGRALKGYLYVPEGRSITEGVPILPEDMIHIRLPNPSDPLEGMSYGLSPFAPMARSADVDNAVTEFLKLFFQRGTAMNVYLKYDIALGEDEAARAKERFSDMYGGFRKWTDVGVMDQGGEIKSFGMNFKEMGFENIDARNEARITGPFGVPLTVLNTLTGMSGATYNNKETDRRIFWEDTMLPELGLHEVDYQYYLRTDDGGFVAFDTRNIPALQKDKTAAAQSFVSMVQVGVTKHTAAAYLNMDLGQLPDGDVIYLPLNLIPMGGVKPVTTPINEQQIVAESEVPDAANQDQNVNKARATKAGQFTPEQKAAQWKAIDRIATKWEPKFAEAARKAFEHDKREVLAIVNDAKTKAKEAKASIGWQDSLLSVEDYLNAGGIDNWRKQFVPAMTGVITDQGEHWAAQLGMSFDVQNLLAQDWFDKYTLTFAQPINDTTLEGLGAMFKQAQAEGWSVPEMQKHMTAMFDQWMTGDLTPDEFTWFNDRMPAYRTEMIARTESIRSSNAGTHELFDEWSISKKEWLSTKDNRTRPDHAEANGQVVNQDKPFRVGGEDLMYPGDPNGSEGNTINCRCTLLPVIGE